MNLIDKILNQKSNHLSFLMEEVEQDITETEEFKAWFGNSKVVDSSGKPLVVYHGTSEDFEEFDINNQSKGSAGKGFYFTFSKKTAKMFSNIRKKGTPNIKKSFVSLKNPLIFEDYKDLPLMGVSQEKVIALGYDGIIVKRNGNMANGEIVVYSSNQIKSVNNKGTFDSGSDNIMESTESNSLESEARKYDSFEEFVEAQGKPVYHGSQESIEAFDSRGAFFTDDYMNADGYAMGEYIYEVYLDSKNLLVIDAKGRKWDDLETEYGKSTQEIVGNVDKKKYDGITFNNIKDNWIDDEDYQDPDTVYYIFDPSKLKSEEQLIYIWNEAHNIMD